MPARTPLRDAIDGALTDELCTHARGRRAASRVRDVLGLQSVYNAGQSKADLLHHVADLAVGGDDQEVMLLERPSFLAVARTPGPEEQIRMIAGLICAILERLAPVWVAYREAAAVDPKAAANLVAAHGRRHVTLGSLVRMLPEERLRRTVEESTDMVWAIASIDVFLLLRSMRGWDAAQYSEWLERTLIDQLLAPEEDAPRRQRRGR